ncbi:hypothetical protein [Phenylobacterium sp.]|uniref:hypothetical protein n=1 Tax=Phenylobacterium sp. TaxID=1871053 RepID=UPI0027347089|nr:hypothetical protein [Phenylobacterium sp.]MDP3660974.1 hypothetical protein [Phenylobacterium sp.]
MLQSGADGGAAAGAPMDTLTFTGRYSMAASETAWRLSDQALEWTSAKGAGAVPLAQIFQVRVFDMPRVTLPLMGGAQLTPSFRQCVVQAHGTRTLKLISTHYQSLGAFEDRAATFEPFVKALIARTAEANPQARFFEGAPGLVWAVWLGALIVCLAGAAFGIAVAVEGLRLGAGDHWGEVLGGLVFAGVCAINIRTIWGMVRSGRRRQLASPTPV